GQAVNFTVAAYEPSDTVLNYQWNFGDGATAAGASVSHTYQASGAYQAYVAISDGAGASVYSGTAVTVLSPMPALKAKLMIRGNGADACTLTGELSGLPTDFTCPGANVTLQVSSVQRSYTLNAKGAAGDGNGSFALHLMPHHGKKAAQ